MADQEDIKKAEGTTGAETAPNAVDSEGVDASPQGPGETPKKKRKKKHLIHPTWLRRTLKILLGLIIFILSIPILIYVPPVQTFLKDVACKIIYDETGMKVKIDKFRVKFPLDASLQGVSVVEATGDTMVMAKEAIADVKVMPLLKLDVKVKKLRLLDGYYRMVSADSSMVMKLKAGFLEVDDKSSVQIKESDINLNKAVLKDADIQMYMDVWKKKETPPDTTTPFLIKINDLTAERIKFGMSMLPTIDTLSLATDYLTLKKGVINLRTNEISADTLRAETGTFEYLTPTEAYIKSHPVPPDTTSTPSEPTIIRATSVILNDFGGLYGVAGAKPQPGFDANYLQVSGVNIALANFFNEGSILRLPIRRLQAKERCGLEITEGSGNVELNEKGINLEDLRIRTTNSNLAITADIPFSLMELQPRAPVKVQADMTIGLRDVVAFMPSLKSYTKYLPANEKLTADITAGGNLSDLRIARLDLIMPSIFSLKASGTAQHPLDMKRLTANINIDGALQNPGTVENFTGNLGFKLPPFRIKGTAAVRPDEYGADLTLLTPQGDIAAKGGVRLTPEIYDANVSMNDVNVGYFMPDLGIGKVTAKLEAHGNGFNPVKPSATTDIDLDVASIDYKGMLFHDLALQAKLHDHNYEVNFNSPNKNLDVALDLVGSIYPDKYSAKGYIDCNDLDLQALGFDTSVNGGSFNLCIDGSASPDRWLYDLTLSVANLDWEFGDQYLHLPADIMADIISTDDSVYLNLDCMNTNLTFESSEGLQDVLDKFMSASGTVMEAVENRNLDIEQIQQALPKFDLQVSTPGEGLVDYFLADSGFEFNTVSMNLRNDSIITGDVDLLGFHTETLALDTLKLGLSQRGSLLDYKFHLGNEPGNMDEFSKVNLNGYIGANRLSAYLTQENVDGENGYKLGLTAALMDSTLTVHFTPLKSVIAYQPWTLNNDNYIDVNLNNYRIEANLEGSSNESSIAFQTQVGADDQQELRLKLTNIKVQDFLNMSVTAPPLTATINSDIRAKYDGHELVGIGRIGITDFTYENMNVDDLNIGLNAAVAADGTSDLAVSLNVEGKKALQVSTKLSSQGDEGMQPEFIKLNLMNFPLSVANPFLGEDVAQLSGRLNGEMDMTGKLTAPLLNGSISCDSVAVYLPIMASSLKFDTEPLVVDNNVIKFNNFDIFGANSNPLTIDGTVDAQKFTDIQLDIKADANNFQLMNNDARAGSDLYGKLFMTLNATAKGPMTHFDVDANLNVLGSTNVSYTLSDATGVIEGDSDHDVVKFVNLQDTVQPPVEDVPQSVYMRMNARVSITPGAQVTVNLSPTTSDRVQLSPSGTLTLYRNFMGDMTLNGQLNLGEGFARYNVPVIGEKVFDFDPGSYVLWNGAMMNPVLNIKATDTERVNVLQSGNSHLVNFLVKLDISNTLSNPKLMFDLSTNDDMTIENQLQSMTADQRNSTAMNLLITGQYTNGDISTSNSNFLMGNVYNFLTSQINSWAARNIKGVDLSFGVDQYNKTVEGQSSTAMSYSYQLSKSLFNNKFKISVGGNYATDANTDENLTQNLISDISFEYMLRQTQSQTMYLKLFRHNGYESILEGEITEMGVGWVLKRKIGDLRQLFRFRRRRRSNQDSRHATDSVTQTQPAAVKATTESTR